ncbi:MAG TPA: hypothetical protein VGT41_01470 [Candidatus Babeliales bacterium]|nr:hypothetical protein [Candidatus Babeliales bacterium]
MKQHIIRIFVAVFCITSPIHAQGDYIPLYFCMASDGSYYEHLTNAIGSVHRYNYDQLEQIAVFDLGLTQEQRNELDSFFKVTVYDLEMTHPDLLKKFSAREGKRNVPGWYAWKPVVIKQALDLFPYVLYMDAGLAIRRPLDDLFMHIQQKGYFLSSSARTVKWMSTDYVIKKFELDQPPRDQILHKKGMLAGLVGITRDLYDDFIMPLYELSKDLRNFAEDGSTKTARHDQPLFSLYAHLLHLDIFPIRERWLQTAQGACSVCDMFDFNARWTGKAITTSGSFVPAGFVPHSAYIQKKSKQELNEI